MRKLKNSIVIIMTALAVTIMLGGCTKQAWYEGFKAGHSMDCGRLEGDAKEKCLKNNDMSYEEYEKNRK